MNANDIKPNDLVNVTGYADLFQVMALADQDGNFECKSLHDGRVIFVSASRLQLDADDCGHPEHERRIVSSAGYLNVPTGPRLICEGCGWDFGSVPAHTYVVTVWAESREQADQVMTERIGPDEDYGFEYRIDWK